MKLKSYLRGIGLGMIVTALVLHFTFGAKAGNTMTEDEIRAEAKKLGMIENTVLSVNPLETTSQNEIQNSTTYDNPVTDVVEGAIPEITEVVTTETNPEEVATQTENSKEGTEDETNQEVNQETVEDKVETKEDINEDQKESETKVEENKEENKQDNTETGTESNTRKNGITKNGQSKTITVAKGDSSYSVAYKLEQAGVIDDAYDFDRYLCENKLDKTMICGEFSVEVGATYEALGKQLSAGGIE